MSDKIAILDLADRVFNAISPAPWQIIDRLKRQDYFGVAYKIEDQQGFPILKTPPIRPRGAPSRSFYNARLTEMAPVLLHLTIQAYGAESERLGPAWAKDFENALLRILTPTDHMPNGMFKG